jgi:hypothetical protein
MRDIIVASFMLVSVVLLSPGVSHAYIDPGTTSYVLQIIIAFFVGVIIAIKSFWLQIKAFFTRTPADKNKETKKHESSKDI